MRNFFKTGFYALLALVTMSACSDDDSTDTPLPSLKVEFTMPDGFTSKFSGEVTISCKELGKDYTADAVDGVANFTSVYPGIYNIQAQQKMTKEEAQAAAPSISFNTAIQLNGVTNGVKVQNATDNIAKVSVNWTGESQLLISKIYGNGTKFNNGRNNNLPKYWEIYNNSSEVLYLDGLCLAQAHGLTTSKNPCKLYQQYQNEATYVSRIATLPGVHGQDKNIALQPGKSLVIAWNASNFITTENTSESATDKCTMNVDLSTADFEIESESFMWKQYGDNPNVPNMTPVYDCLPSAGFMQMNHAMLIFFATPDQIQSWVTDNDDSSYTVSTQKALKAKRVPNDIILDAVETFKASASQQKRIPDALDAKGIEDGNNTGSIFDRKVLYIAEDGRKVLQDTNNSSADFVVVASRNPEQFDGSHLVIRDYDKPEIQPAK